MRVLDALIDLIKVRDQLANMEEKLQHLRRVVDGSVNEIMDFMQEQNLIKVADVGDGVRFSPFVVNNLFFTSSSGIIFIY
jgi:hypothetical protein